MALRHGLALPLDGSMQVTAGSASHGELPHPTNDASVNGVKVCSHGKLKSEITALSDANTRGNEGSAPSMSVTQCLIREGKQDPVPEAGPFTLNHSLN